MEPVLIFTDSEKIDNEKGYLESVVVYLQSTYDALNAIGVEVTLDELISICTLPANLQPGAIERKVTDFVQDYLLNKAGTPDFNGVPISRDKLKELLSIPDLSAVLEEIEGYNQWRKYGYGIVKAWLKLDAGIISKSDNSDSLIENQYTYYTKNDAGAELAGKLNTLCQALTAHHQYERIMSSSGLTSTGHNQLPIQGVEYRNGSFYPSLHYIRRREEMRPDYVAG